MAKLIIITRSFFYNLFYISWTLILSILYIPILLSPWRMPQILIRIWAKGLLHGARVLAGIRWTVEGTEHLPSGPCLFAVKHQSAWDTLFFPAYFPHITFVLKRELLFLPFVGWYMAKAGTIAINRKAGASALKKMLHGVESAFQRNASVLLFPEGTRVAVGDKKPYQSGVAALYSRFGKTIPVIPVALNSGLFWGKNAFLKYPGTIHIRFLPPMPHGLDKRAFTTLIADRIEQETQTLCRNS